MKTTVIKRSVVLAGRKTSISIEDAFWKAMREIADQRRMSMSALVEVINTDRKDGNLSSAVRLFVLGIYQDRTAGRRKRQAA
jgi:predicted DNA-binding ribbon-helix-helix protein